MQRLMSLTISLNKKNEFLRDKQYVAELFKTIKPNKSIHESLAHVCTGMKADLYTTRSENECRLTASHYGSTLCNTCDFLSMKTKYVTIYFSKPIHWDHVTYKHIIKRRDYFLSCQAIHDQRLIANSIFKVRSRFNTLILTSWDVIFNIDKKYNFIWLFGWEYIRVDTAIGNFTLLLVIKEALTSFFNC